MEQELTAERIKNIRQERDRFTETCVELPQLIIRKLRNVATAIRRPIDRLIMNDYDTAVGAPANIELDAVCTAIEGFLE